MGSIRSIINILCGVHDVDVFLFVASFFVSYLPLWVTDLMEFALHFRSFKCGLKIHVNVVVNGYLISAVSTVLT